MKIKSFTDLIAWQKGHKLGLEIYKSTKNFPKEELYCLTSQIRRCAISITSNIAEGFSRQSSKEKKQFFSTSLGSLTELQNQLLMARDLEYINNKDFNYLAEMTVEVSKLINSLIKSAPGK
jgi:four helix bundle protein